MSMKLSLINQNLKPMKLSTCLPIKQTANQLCKKMLMKKCFLSFSFQIVSFHVALDRIDISQPSSKNESSFFNQIQFSFLNVLLPVLYHSIQSLNFKNGGFVVTTKEIAIMIVTCLSNQKIGEEMYVEIHKNNKYRSDYFLLRLHLFLGRTVVLWQKTLPNSIS